MQTGKITPTYVVGNVTLITDGTQKFGWKVQMLWSNNNLRIGKKKLFHFKMRQRFIKLEKLSHNSIRLWIWTYNLPFWDYSWFSPNGIFYQHQNSITFLRIYIWAQILIGSSLHQLHTYFNLNLKPIHNMTEIL